MKKFVTTIATGVAVLSLASCAGFPNAAPANIAPPVEAAVNLPTTVVDPKTVQPVLIKTQLEDIWVYLFDVERDGEILTCSARSEYGSGVTCWKK